jgi:2-(1,2-epoxy-1,2-dihydrophenyl)acetyl-CoA isomerase
MNYEEISLDSSAGVVTITFNRPAKLNAFTFRMLDEVNHVLRREVGTGTRAVLFRGAGRAFCSGDSLTGMGGGGHPLDNMRAGHHAMIKRIRALRIPVVAAVHGFAYGAAFDLILACDFRLAAESALVGDIRMNRAINSMAGAAYWLPRYVGVGRASEILLLGERIIARQALDWGLLTRVFPDAEFESGVAEFMARLATMPTAVIGANKSLLNFGLDNFLAPALEPRRGNCSRRSRPRTTRKARCHSSRSARPATPGVRKFTSQHRKKTPAGCVQRGGRPGPIDRLAPDWYSSRSSVPPNVF